MTSWCRQCGHDTRLLPPEDAAILTGVSPREIYRRLEVGQVHFTESNVGRLLICLSSVVHNAPEEEVSKLYCLASQKEHLE